MRRRRPYYCGRLRPVLVLAALGAVGILLWSHFLLGPSVAEIATVQARTIATKAVNQSTNLFVQQSDTSYEQLAIIQRGPDGQVTSVQANMPRINALASEVTSAVVEELQLLARQPVEIPLGTLIGGQLFSGRGPKLSFYVVHRGGLESTVHNEFTSAGINQTMHRILLEFRIDILGILPGYTASTTITTQICLAETIIIGAVPEYYTQVEGSDDDPADIISNYGPGQNAVG